VELGWPITEAEVIEQFVGRSAASIGALIAARPGRDLAERWARGSSGCIVT